MISFKNINGEIINDDVMHLIESIQRMQFSELLSDVQEVKKELLLLERLPLFDIKSYQIFMIHKKNIYNRIFHDSYRFIDKKFYDDIMKFSDKIGIENKLYPLKIIVSFYDVDELKKLYHEAFYESFVFNEYITSCYRPSFFSYNDHIKPYYGLNELYYLAFDWKIIKDKNDMSPEEICSHVKQYDIEAQILIDHQLYIYDSKAIGIVKHYSLFGSYYMNNYLRKNKKLFSGDNKKITHNEILEDQIMLFTKVIKNAPAFTKDHTVYRFIENDDYLSNIKPGDIFIDNSFISTTRNPFYYQENYQFGYILIKIKIPAGVKGVGICVESYSNFPLEEEIVLPPLTKLRLDSVEENIDLNNYYHVLTKKIARKYEFTCVGHDDIDSIVRNGTLLPMKYFDVDEIDVAYLSTQVKDYHKRIRGFINNYCNHNHQFMSVVNGKEYVFQMNYYDSSTVYKKYFYYETESGILIYLVNPKHGNINLMIEIGPEIHVNYYFKYSTHQLDIDNEPWLLWLSWLAFTLGINTVIIHPLYLLYEKKGDIITRLNSTKHTILIDVYNYFKYGTKRFDGNIHIKPNFDYFQLDYIASIKTERIIIPGDELSQIYSNNKADKFSDFYLFIVERYPNYREELEKRLAMISELVENPIFNIHYKIDAGAILYDRNLTGPPTYDNDFVDIINPDHKKVIAQTKLNKFENRLRTYIN